MSGGKIEYIQWYPGHMAKAKREIKEKLKLINVIIKLVDARLLISSKNPDINECTWNKQHILLMNKADLADPKVELLIFRERFHPQDHLSGNPAYLLHFVQVLTPTNNKNKGFLALLPPAAQPRK